jgi:hypothetical protein
MLLTLEYMVGHISYAAYGVLQDISNLKQHMEPAWLIIGDFNLIYRAEDMNN